MLSEIEKRFGSIHVARGSYLYRYLCDGLTSVNVARHIMSVEERRIADASLRAVGLRVVARRIPTSAQSTLSPS